MQAGVSMPFTPSHCEALTQDGKFYIGAHFAGGVKARPVGYDAGEVAPLDEGGLCDRAIAVPSSPDQATAFYLFLNGKIDEAYDWKSIFGFAAPDLHTHLLDHIICSALMVAALRAAKIFPWPLTVPFHHITPRDLMLMLSSVVEVPH